MVEWQPATSKLLGRRTSSGNVNETACRYNKPKGRNSHFASCANDCTKLPEPAELLLPGALLVAMLAQLLAPFVLVDFRFATFFQ